MARPHHRKKHRQQLRQFKQREDVNRISGKRTKAATIFAIIGIITGLAITYFATDGDIAWMIGGVIAGGLIGYFAGKNIDKSEG